MLSPLERQALNDVAGSLGVKPDTLSALIQFESGWNPAARNAVTGARGLIQFMPATARNLGYDSADDLVTKERSRAAQLYGPVLRYLSRYKPFPTDQSLFMAVFYPRARSWSRLSTFPPAVQSANPGIKTVDDYIRKVWFASNIRYVPALAALVALVGAAFFLLKTGR